MNVAVATDAASAATRERPRISQFEWGFEQGLIDRLIPLEEFFTDALHQTAES
jgi:hypothetical protein